MTKSKLMSKLLRGEHMHDLRELCEGEGQVSIKTVRKLVDECFDKIRQDINELIDSGKFYDGDLVKIKYSNSVYSFDRYIGGGRCIVSDISGRTLDTYLYNVELHERRGII